MKATIKKAADILASRLSLDRRSFNYFELLDCETSIASKGDDVFSTSSTFS